MSVADTGQIGRCKDCRHWKRDRAGSGTRTEWHACALADSDNDEAVYSGSLAIAQDVDMFEAWLETSPQFGCVQFAPLLPDWRRE